MGKAFKDGDDELIIVDGMVGVGQSTSSGEGVAARMIPLVKG